MTFGFATMGFLVGSLLPLAGDLLLRVAPGKPGPAMDSSYSHIPALGWLLKSSLSTRQPRRLDQWIWLGAGIELLTAALFALLWIRFGLSLRLLLLSSGICFFLLIAIIDLRHHLVLNILVYPAAALVVFMHILLPEGTPISALVGGLFGLGIFLITALLRPGELGMGDVKLAGLIGLVVGFPLVLWALALGIIAGGVTAIVLLFASDRRLDSHIPYAPFLCFGAIAALLVNPLPLILPP